MHSRAAGSRCERFTAAHIAATDQKASPSRIVRSRNGRAFVVPNPPSALTAKRRELASSGFFAPASDSAARTSVDDSSSGVIFPLARK